jgi:uncharacterized DUF497 family protein
VGQYGDFDWDDEKDRQNLKKHGLPLIAAAALFDDPDAIDGDSPRAHGNERRRIASGAVRGRLVTCVYVWRDGRRRIISVRSASRKERRVYDEAKR